MARVYLDPFDGQLYELPPASVFPGDHKVLVDGADTTPDYLSTKVSVIGGLTKAILNPGADEVLQIGLPLSGYFSLSGAGGAFAKTNPVNAVQKQMEIGAGNHVNNLVAQFPEAVQSFFGWGFSMPSNWDGGDVFATVDWSATSASLDSVVWGVQGRVYAAGDPFDAAWGAAREVTSANTGTDCQNYSAETAAITLAGAVTPRKRVNIRCYRLGAGADNLAVPANLLELVVRYGVA